MDADRSSSRFFGLSDRREDAFVLPLPAAWWSRPYEYAWCAGFAEPGGIALDAACGISHPFKFYLASVCREAHACDWDARIASEAEILADVERDFGRPAAEELARSGLPGRVRRAHADITALPYAAETFDTVFCISVLEHLGVPAMAKALGQFHRVLKPRGRLALTFDYPTVDLQVFRLLADAEGFAFAGPVDEKLPQDAVTSTMWGRLYCYRALLEKRA